MEKVYDPKTIEANWYPQWENAGYFAPNKNAEAYCIMLPPPNVTGSLHMGHGFQHTLMDALTRYHRMCGENVLWQPGTDHSGIAAQMVVERRLASQGKTRHELGRTAFLDEVWRWKEESGTMITRQMRRIGSSVDWPRERFTMDEGLSKAVHEAFIRLYEEGLIYRGKRLVNWDPTLHTAVSDLEVNIVEEDGHLWHLRYPLVESDDYLVVATTRPETLFGDVAVAVHPDDERYQHLIGKHLRLPLTDRQIPIIADTYVEPEFGSGCVKITPAHDFNDYQVGLRHELTPINVFTIEAHLNENVPERYRGMHRAAARKEVIDDLSAKNLVEKIEPYKCKIPRGERSGDILEPYLTDQWYVKTQPLAKPAIAAVEKGDVRFVPDTWNKTYFQWMHNIEDWCISRQLWWGHRIPAWYDEAGKIYVGDDESHVRQKYKLSASVKLKQDEDVLDTWFSSALWPFSTLGWPEETPELKTFYPTNVLVTGFDIIFFWVARMIMFGLKFTNQVPFKEVYITGLIRDAEGQKMSKSKGNVLDPIDLIDGIDLESLVKQRTSNLMQGSMTKKIEQNTRKQFPNGIPAFGTDALRFTFCALATTGRDIRFDLNRIEGYRNFCNKLWNATRYVLMNTEGHANETPEHLLENLSLADRWILSQLQTTITQAHHYFETYRFDLLAQALYEFTWNEYCDWYLELAKPILTSENSSPEAQQATRHTLLYVLETLLRLLHPLMPYITEEIWQKIAPLTAKTGKTIMLEAYPVADDALINQEAVDELEWLKAVILAIRNIRGEMNISPNKTLAIVVQKYDALDRERLEKNKKYLSGLAKITSIEWLDKSDTPPAAATALVGRLEILIPLADLIDKDAEIVRLNKELEKLRKELQQSETKLANESYVAKAPAEVVAKERQRVEEFKTAIEKFSEQLAKMQML